MWAFSLSSLPAVAVLALALAAAPRCAGSLPPCSGTMPAPFSTPLRLGNDSAQVVVLHHLLARTPTGEPQVNLSDTNFGIATRDAVRAFQSAGAGAPLSPTGVVDRATALALLDDAYTDDHYEDDGTSAADHGPSTNIKIPVHRTDRSRLMPPSWTRTTTCSFTFRCDPRVTSTMGAGVLYQKRGQTSTIQDLG